MSINTKFLLVLLISLGGCTKTDPSLTPLESRLIAEVKMDSAVALKVKSYGTSLERLMGITANDDEVPADGIILNTKPKAGRETLAKVRAQLIGTPYRAFLREDSFGYGPDRIAVVNSDEYGYLAIVRTDGINYGIEHEKVVERYKQWNKKYGLKLIGAGLDWLEAEFINPPGDWTAFAEEVYEFCPDVVEQGTGAVDSLAKEMKDSNKVYLWWD